MGNDLWPKQILNQEYEKNHAVEILKEQAKILAQKTEGKVKATFSRIDYQESFNSLTKIKGFSQVNRLMTKSESSLYLEKTPEIIEEELKDKTNINYLYDKTLYKFELYNVEFRFRIVILKNCIEFRIDIGLEEGISNELYINRNIIIESNQELEELLKRVFSSKKVQLILNRMIHSSDVILENNILDYLAKNPESTTIEIARALKTTVESAEKRIEALSMKGKIYEYLNMKPSGWGIVHQ